MDNRKPHARKSDADRVLIIVAPGWIRTTLGSPDASFTRGETMPRIVLMLLDRIGRPGLRFLDRLGEAVLG